MVTLSPSSTRHPHLSSFSSSNSLLHSLPPSLSRRPVLPIPHPLPLQITIPICPPSFPFYVCISFPMCIFFSTLSSLPPSLLLPQNSAKDSTILFDVTKFCLHSIRDIKPCIKWTLSLTLGTLDHWYFRSLVL